MYLSKPIDKETLRAKLNNYEKCVNSQLINKTLLLYNMDIQKKKHEYLVQWLIYFKKDKGINNTKAAAMVGITQSSLAQMKTGTRSISDSFINTFYACFRDYGVGAFKPSEPPVRFYKDLSLEEIEGIADRLLEEVIQLKHYIRQNKSHED
jgi:DNA-binding protein Fis